MRRGRRAPGGGGWRRAIVKEVARYQARRRYWSNPDAHAFIGFTREGRRRTRCCRAAHERRQELTGERAAARYIQPFLWDEYAAARGVRSAAVRDIVARWDMWRGVGDEEARLSRAAPTRRCCVEARRVRDPSHRKGMRARHTPHARQLALPITPPAAHWRPSSLVEGEAACARRAQRMLRVWWQARMARVTRIERTSTNLNPERHEVAGTGAIGRRERQAAGAGELSRRRRRAVR